eukprot:TRINITY_DN187_c0_g1_i1.p1 TRINITY_DN187_c0_g1~~TRINITY_DN187_c0_g1_i1.p1  ORF type:complete len:378 (-),score=108.68 TRINITY_DN187_c0_g1_i1:38-1135(-)
MGNAESSNHSHGGGFHILQVQPNSPGSRAGLHSYFDFIVAANGIPLIKEDTQFVDLLRGNLNKEIKITVYNLRTETTRETILIPSDSWGGSGLAGLSIRFCPFEQVVSNVWHILDVYMHSPAFAAGLQPRVDYIVGTPELLMTESEDFFTLIESNEQKPIPLYVYNSDTDNVRLIRIVPNASWGGHGSLGCDIGYGFLHRIPMNRGPRSPAASPPVQISQNQFIPHPTATSPIRANPVAPVVANSPAVGSVATSVNAVPMTTHAVVTNTTPVIPTVPTVPVVPTTVHAVSAVPAVSAATYVAPASPSVVTTPYPAYVPPTQTSPNVISSPYVVSSPERSLETANPYSMQWSQYAMDQQKYPPSPQ